MIFACSYAGRRFLGCVASSVCSRSAVRGKRGRSPAKNEIPALIQRMTRENRTWGASRIHDELVNLGCRVAPSAVAKQMPKCSQMVLRDRARERAY